MTNRYLCIHGHFYQPPRENPWLEEIDYQVSARPYHDWNERISAECYRANGLSRILDHEGWVVKLSNNYSRISFNFGPTLLSWMEKHDPQAYEAIIEGDKISQTLYGGHGSAIAQAYNHIIMPLANRRDKITQVKWGLRDFETRFGRAAEAMWLPETAVDLETLEIMVDHGLKYVVLAPRQAQAVRPLNGDHLWESVRGERVDTRMPYLIKLPNGKSISAFFYNGELSRAVAFEGLLNNGDNFATRLCSGFDHTAESQLMHIATDGESYGHHHLKGDMALAYTLDQIEKRSLANLTNYGQYLELFPPTHEAAIYEDSSWSCIHGIERWYRDCGCNSGGQPKWNQKWREPLRKAFDFLRDNTSACYEEALKSYTDNAWDMRDDYITIIQDRSAENRKAFLKKWINREILPADEIKIFRMLELQRNLLLMYTSCAWFFDEISGVETVQSLSYAGRVLELANSICEEGLEDQFLHMLQNAPSNIPDFSNGRIIFDRLVRPSQIDFLKVGVPLAAQALFQNRQFKTIFACFDIEWLDVQRVYSGRAQLIAGHVKIISRITREEYEVELVAVHLTDHNINIGVLPYGGQEYFDKMKSEFIDTFESGDLSKSLRLLDKYFEGNIYYLNDLFHEQQKEIIDNVFSQTLEGVEEQFTGIYERHYAVMSYLSRMRISLPQVFSHIAHFVQNMHIQKYLKDEEINFEEIERYLEEAKSWNVELDKAHIETLYIKALQRSFEDAEEHPADTQKLENFRKLVTLSDLFPFECDLGEIQKAFAARLFNKPKNTISNNQLDELEHIIASVLKIRTEGISSV